MFPTKPYTVEDGKLCSCLGMILKGFPPHASWDLPIHQPERNLLPQSSRGCGGWTIFILKFGLKIILSTNHQLRIARFSPPWTHLFLCPLHLPCWRTHSCPDSKSPRESGRPDAIKIFRWKLSTLHFQSAPGLWHFYRFRIPMSLHFSLWFSGNIFNSFASFHLKMCCQIREIHRCVLLWFAASFHPPPVCWNVPTKYFGCKGIPVAFFWVVVIWTCVPPKENWYLTDNSIIKTSIFKSSHARRAEKQERKCMRLTWAHVSNQLILKKDVTINQHQANAGISRRSFTKPIFSPFCILGCKGCHLIQPHTWWTWQTNRVSISPIISVPKKSIWI